MSIRYISKTQFLTWIALKLHLVSWLHWLDHLSLLGVAIEVEQLLSFLLFWLPGIMGFDLLGYLLHWCSLCVTRSTLRRKWKWICEMYSSLTTNMISKSCLDFHFTSNIVQSNVASSAARCKAVCPSGCIAISTSA